MDAVQELKETCDKIGRAFEDLKSTNDAQIAKGVKDGLAEAKLSNLNDAITELSAHKETLEKKIKDEASLREDLERRVNKLRLGSKADDEGIDPVVEVKMFNDSRRTLSNFKEVTVEQYQAYKVAFDKVLRKGVEDLEENERKDLRAGVDSDGGYTLPPPTMGRVVSKIFELSPIRQIADVQTISTNAIEGVLDNDEMSYGWVAEEGARSKTTTATLGKWRIEANEMYAAPIATQTLIDDSAWNIEAWLAAKQADKFARVEGSAFINGNGVGQPRGFAQYTTAATGDATRAWGTIEHVTTGTSADFNSTTQANPIFSLIQAFKNAYLANARFVTTREVINKIRVFKTTTTAEYIWQPGLQKGVPDQLLGYPIVYAQDMPALAANSLSLAFGDFREAYTIVDRMGIRTLRDPYTNKPYVIFYSTKRVGGGVLNFEAIKFIKFI